MIRDVHSNASLRQGRIRHLSIRLRPDFDGTTIHFRARYLMDRPIHRKLYLDSRGIRLDRADAGGSRIRFEFDQDDPILGQRLVLHDLDGSAVFVLEGTTSSEASALQWLTPAMTGSGKQPFLYTQCQAIHARSLFPCQDTPSVRFTFAASVEVPDDLTAVMGAEFRGKTQKGTAQVYRFRMPQPIPSYLFALAVGDLAFRPTSLRCGVYAEPALVEAAAWEFGRAEHMLQTAEAMFGPYLWDRYDILVLPKGFPWGGMENPRLTFLSPSLIAGDRTFDRVVAHELGHAWTGNLVTNATWEDFWLNEGWTTHLQHRLEEAIDGSEIASFTLRSASDQLSAELRRLRKHPEQTALVFGMEGMDPDDAVTPLPYIKGAMFLQAVEQAVGRERFDRFVRTYIRRFSFRPITTEVFLRFLKTELPGIGRKVSLRQWVYARGMPPAPPKVKSDLYEQVRAVRRRFKAGVSPTRQEVSAWSWRQVYLFFLTLPRKATLEQCRALEDAFDLGESKNLAVLGMYYPHAIRAGNAQVLPRVHAYLDRQGMVYYLQRIYEALAQADWSRQQVGSLYAEFKPGYHPITRRIIEQALSEAGVRSP